MNLPNKLSLVRIFLVPILCLFFILGTTWATILAIVLFLLAVFTDFLDGYIARSTNQVTDLGKLLDPIADKMLVCCTLFLLVEKNVFTQMGHFPIGVGGFCCALIISRELLISVFRQLGATKGLVIQANSWGKIKAIFQYISIPTLMLLSLQVELLAISEVLYEVIYWFGILTFAISTVLTIVSAVIYVVQNRKLFKDIKN